MSLYCIFNDLKAKLLIGSFSRIACSAFIRIFGVSTSLLHVLSCHLLSPMVSQGIKKSHWHIEYIKYEELSALPHHEVLLWVIYMVIRKWHWNGIRCLSFWILFLPCGKNCQYQNDPEVTFYKSVHLSFAEVTFKLAEMIFYLFQDIIYQMQILMHCYSYCFFLTSLQLCSDTHWFFTTVDGLTPHTMLYRFPHLGFKERAFSRWNPYPFLSLYKQHYKLTSVFCLALEL